MDQNKRKIVAIPNKTKPQSKLSQQNKIENKEKSEQINKIKDEQILSQPVHQFLYYVPYGCSGVKSTISQKEEISQNEDNSSSSCKKQRSRSRNKKQNHTKQNIRCQQKKSQKYDPHKSEVNVLSKQDAYKKTRICEQHQRGRCSKGQYCMYAHSRKQLRGLPDLRKTKPCYAFNQGQCLKKSHQCKYAHGVQQLRNSPAIIKGNKSKKRDPNNPSGFQSTPVPLENSYGNSFRSIKSPYQFEMMHTPYITPLRQEYQDPSFNIYSPYRSYGSMTPYYPSSMPQIPPVNFGTPLPDRYGGYGHSSPYHNYQTRPPM